MNLPVHPARFTGRRRRAAVPLLPVLSGLLLALLLSAELIVSAEVVRPPVPRFKRPAFFSTDLDADDAVDAAKTLPLRGGAAAAAASPAKAIAAPPSVNLSPLTAIFQSFAKTVADARTHLAAAAAARATSIFAMYPVDTIKTRMQLGQANPFRLSGLYNGVSGSLFGQVPYGVLTFGSYEIYKQSLLKRFPNVKPAFVYALSAILGDVTGSGWLCPSEVAKQQLQAGIYPSMGEAIGGIWKKGGLGGFYQGYTGGLARDVPFRVAQLTTFEVTKSLYLRAKRRRSSSDEPVALSAFEAAMCGAAAGSFSAAVTNPLDRIKTLMMTDTTGAYGGSVLACASKVIKEEGLGGMLAGVVPRVGYIAPSVCIFFVTYELVQQKLGINKPED